MHIICRREGDIRRRLRLSSPSQEGDSPPYHQPQLLRRNQRPRNGTVDVSRLFHTSRVQKTRRRSEMLEGRLNFSSFLRIKEKFPYAFDDICLYSEVSHLLSHCMFRLTSRRFIQELFQDVQFMPVRKQTLS